MQKTFMSIIILLLLVSSAQTKTIKADVTGDYMNDKIEMGLKSVVVTDFISCCTRRKYTVVSEVENLADIMVDDFHRGVRGNEIAVTTLPNHDYVTQVYGYKGKKFANLSDLLPGQISFDDNKQLFGYHTHIWRGKEIQVPWPIIEDMEFLTPAILVQEIETTAVVDSGTTKEIVIDMLINVLTVVVAVAGEKDAVIFLVDSDGTLITQRAIDTELPMVGKSFADENKTISLVIDNLQSTTPKTVYYIIKHYIKKLLSVEIKIRER